MDSLVLATARGIRSHGINLVNHYGRSVLTGRKNPNPNFKINTKYSSSKSLDADHTFGASAGYYAVKNIVPEVKKFGISSCVNPLKPNFFASKCTIIKIPK